MADTEIRVYIADGTSYYKNLDGKSDIEDVMECAEAQGNVMTLSTFIDLFNKGELDLAGENTIVRAVEFDTDQYEFIKEF